MALPWHRSGHRAPRQHLAREFGATEIVAERGDAGIARIKELTDGLGAAPSSNVSAPASRCCRRSARPDPAEWSALSAPRTAWRFRSRTCSGRTSDCAAARAGAELPARFARPGLEPADRAGKVFDVELPLEQVADAYQAMDERRAIKALLWP